MVPYDLLVARLDGRKPAALDTIVANATIDNFARGVFWSPSGATLLYSVRDSMEKHEFFAADSNGWKPRPIATTGVAAIGTDSIVPFGRSIWWDRRGSAFYIVGRHTVAMVSMPDGVARSLARLPADLEPLALVERQSPERAWTDSAGRLTLVFRNQVTKNMGFLRVDPVTGEFRVLRDENHSYGGRLDFRTDATRDGRIAYLSEDAQHPTDVWLASPDLAMTRRITHVAPEMESVRFGSTQLIDFKTTSGAARRGALLLPSDYEPGKRYPLVVYPYPADERSEDVNVFGLRGPGTDNMQLLATRGFAVLAPDVWPFDTKDEMRELASIIMPGIDRVIELGIADSTRLGIIGHSWGGYTVMALIAQTPRFGAAVMRGGFGDPATSTATLQMSGYAYGIMHEEVMFGAPLWEQPELYRKNSPLYLLDRVRTPLLIIHGEAETTSPIFLADQVFAGLQRLGREVEFARYANENHTEALWASANRRDYLSRVIGWFESHLKGERKTTSPAPAFR
jgi:dipeptidyl aminopeptidase/acylaminoacyl peptidase